MTEPQPLNNDTEHLAKVKSNLDLAWAKVQNALQLEAEGRKQWIEGTLELINILHDARQRHPSDQAFGKWLADSGYGEDRITRNDRSALLNMAEYPDLTRKVLEQTHRRSWRLIWEEEIQPGLHSAGQPADDEQTNTPEQPAEGENAEPAPINNPEPADTKKKPTRRPKAKKAPKAEWEKDDDCFFSDALEASNKLVAIENSIQQMDADQDASKRKKVTPAWQEKIEEGFKALTFIRDWGKGSLKKEARRAIQEGRVKTTFARTSGQVQPEA
jgi:hypothetical protein